MALGSHYGKCEKNYRSANRYDLAHRCRDRADGAASGGGALAVEKAEVNRRTFLKSVGLTAVAAAVPVKAPSEAVNAPPVDNAPAALESLGTWTSTSNTVPGTLNGAEGVRAEWLVTSANTVHVHNNTISDVGESGVYAALAGERRRE